LPSTAWTNAASLPALARKSIASCLERGLLSPVRKSILRAVPGSGPSMRYALCDSSVKLVMAAMVSRDRSCWSNVRIARSSGQRVTVSIPKTQRRLCGSRVML
jgi:hypothetical protein